MEDLKREQLSPGEQAALEGEKLLREQWEDAIETRVVKQDLHIDVLSATLEPNQMRAKLQQMLGIKAHQTEGGLSGRMYPPDSRYILKDMVFRYFDEEFSGD